MEKKLYAIHHCYDEDGGFGDAIPQDNTVGFIMATEQEIQAFVQKWNQPEVYDRPFADLTCHSIWAEEVAISDISDFKPYDTDPNDYFNQGIQQMKSK